MPRFVHQLVQLRVVAVFVALAAVLAGCQGGKMVREERPPPVHLERGPLLDQVRPSKDVRVYYSPPTLRQRLVLQRVLPMFYRELADGKTHFGDYTKLFAKAGLRMHRLVRGREVWIVLSEGGKDWRGTGAYVFRTGPVDHELIVQAPHTYHDYHTGTIAERIFRQESVRGFFFNTCHRYRPYPEGTDNDRVHPADMAHVTDSYFHLFSVEYLTQISDTALVQIHGFERRALRKNDIGVVLSNGTDTPSAWAQRMSDRLHANLGGVAVAVYPSDTHYYGATSNAQASWVEAYHRGAFLHVELSRRLRERLIDDDELLQTLAQSIVKTQ